MGTEIIIAACDATRGELCSTVDVDKMRSLWSRLDPVTRRTKGAQYVHMFQERSDRPRGPAGFTAPFQPTRFVITFSPAKTVKN